MPPRYAYWTILVDEQPTAFRAGDRDDLQPTFKRLKEKHPSARMVWFQNGKIWDSRLDAQEAMRARGEMGRRGDVRQRGGFRNRGDRPAPPVERRDPAGKLEWKPKGEGSERPKAEWRPKGTGFSSRPQSAKPAGVRRENGRPSRPQARERKLEWQPKGTGTSQGPRRKTQDPEPRTQAPSPRTQDPKRKWIPKEEYKKSQGIEARRDKNWRPGGAHKDPRQKYKDAKKAKWGRFKQTVRKRWETKQGKKKKADE